MNRSVLAVLLLLSVSLNVWLWMRPGGLAESRVVDRIVARPVAIHGGDGASPGKPEGAKEAAAERTETKETGTSGPAKDDPATLTEDELLFGPIYGAGGMAKAATHGEPTGRVSPERLKALAKEEPSKAEKFRVSGVLHLPGDRVLDLGSVSVEPGRAMKFERIRESRVDAGVGEEGGFGVCVFC